MDKKPLELYSTINMVKIFTKLLFCICFYLILCKPVYSRVLDKPIAIGTSQNIIVTYSDLLLLKVQTEDQDITNRELLDNLIRREVFLKYIKQTNLVRVRYDEVLYHYNSVMQDDRIKELINRYVICPLFIKISLEKQLYIEKFIQYSFLASINVTREDIERFFLQNPEYEDILPEEKDNLLKEIETRIRDKKIKERINRDIGHLIKNIHILVCPDGLEL